MGGRITVESVVRCLWNGWPDDRGIRKNTLSLGEVDQPLPQWEVLVVGTLFSEKRQLKAIHGNIL